MYQDRLFKLVSHMPRKKLIWIGLFCLASLLLSALAALLSAFPKHDIIPSVNFHSRALLKSPGFAVIALFLFLGSAIAAIWVAIAEILSLRPSGLIDKARKNINDNHLKMYLIKKYGLQKPFLIRFHIEGIDEPEEMKERFEKEDKQYAEDMKVYESLMGQSGNENDPLEAIGELAIRSIRNRDTSLLEKALNALGEALQKNIRVKEGEGSNWGANSFIYGHLIEHLLMWISFLIEECRKEGSSRLAGYVYGFTDQIASEAVKKGDLQAAKRIISYWKLEADQALSGDTRTFIQLIGLQRKLGEELFSEQDDGSKAEMLNEVFRSLGWLGERLLEKGIEKKPLMQDRDYETSYDALFEAILTFDDLYKRQRPKDYPLIFFDAVSVFFEGLLKEMKKHTDKAIRQKIYEHVFDCAYVYSSFATTAIQAGNGSGASLAAVKLVERYKELRENADDEKLDKDARDTMGLLLDLGLGAAGQPVKNTSADFLPEGIEKRMLDILSAAPAEYSQDLASQVFEGFIRFDRARNLEGGKEFIKKLGAARNSDFGLNLSP
jgi:hypothetical protein